MAMKTLTERIIQEAAGQPEGHVICAKALLHLGSRAAVDQALSRLARRGKLMRAGRGFYVLPIESRFGTRAPTPEKLVASLASARGETIVEHGAQAANQLGLSTQVPIRSIFVTSGPSRAIQVGNRHIELQHAPRWQLACGLAGSIIRALAWMGPEHSHEALCNLKGKLPATALEEVARHQGTLPNWLAQEVATVQHARSLH